MKMTTIRAIALVLLLAPRCYADGIWNNLLGLEIVVGTATLKGYGVWPSTWLSDAGVETLSEEKLIERFRKESVVEFVAGVEPIAYPSNTLVSTEPFQRIAATSIRSLRRLPMDHDNHSWAGVMNQFSEREAKDMKQPPLAQCEEIPDWCKVKRPRCYGNVYWVSYNPEFTEGVLKGLCSGPLAGRVNMTPGLRQARVYRFEVSGD